MLGTCPGRFIPYPGEVGIKPGGLGQKTPELNDALPGRIRVLRRDLGDGGGENWENPRSDQGVLLAHWSVIRKLVFFVIAT